MRIENHLFEDFDIGLAPRCSDSETMTQHTELVERSCAAAYAAGYEAGAAAAHAQADSSVAAMAERLDARLDSATALHRQVVEAVADEIARIVLQGFIAMMPATMARHGATEIAEFLAIIKPALQAGGELRLVISTADADAIAAVLQHLPPERRARVTVNQDARYATGDIEAHWDGGNASRHGEQLRRDIVALLKHHGLMAEADTLLIPA